MKNLFKLLFVLALFQPAAAKEFYTADWSSITTHEIPDWALDAKFGIYAHWGPYSIIGSWEENTTYPSFGNYYTCGYRDIYDPKQNAIRTAFESRYGSIKDGHGYYDICEDFTAKGFDPAAWAELVKESGATYAGTCALHHDGYMMWDSEVGDLNAAKIGAKRDLLGELFAELRKRDIKTIASLHHGRTKNYFNGYAAKLKGKSEYSGVDFLRENAEDRYWFMGSNEDFREKELLITEELINKYQPDVLWFDGSGEAGAKEVISTFLNMGERENKDVVLHNKHYQFGNYYGVFSYERGMRRPHNLLNYPWEDDDTSGVDGSWCWWHGITYRKSDDLIKRLCHLTATNGGLLLSLNVRPDGSFDPELIEQLKGIGRWMKQNGEAINGTRPWKIQGEGNMDESKLEYQYSTAKFLAKPKEGVFNVKDIRFTTHGNTLYAIQLGIPTNGKSVITTLSNKNRVGSKDVIESIELLGYGAVKYERTDNALTIDLPKSLPNDVALVFKIEVKGELKRILFEGTR